MKNISIQSFIFEPIQTKYMPVNNFSKMYQRLATLSKFKNQRTYYLYRRFELKYRHRSVEMEVAYNNQNYKLNSKIS